MTPPSDRPPTLAREIGARAVAIEHALEEVAGAQYEKRLHAAEETITYCTQHPGRARRLDLGRILRAR